MIIFALKCAGLGYAGLLFLNFVIFAGMNLLASVTFAVDLAVGPGARAVEYRQLGTEALWFAAVGAVGALITGLIIAGVW